MLLDLYVIGPRFAGAPAREQILVSAREDGALRVGAVELVLFGVH